MMLRLIAPIALVAAAPVSPQTEVMAAMTASAAGWNGGNLDRFMAIYATDAIFVTPKGLLRGSDEIAAHYRPSFTATGNTRGKLSFEALAYRRLSAVHLVLFARWTLTGAKVETGMTTLVFERRPAGWRIISDHSS